MDKRIFIALGLAIAMSRGTLFGGQDEDLEMKEAIRLCQVALDAMARGKSTYGTNFDSAIRTFALLDSKRLEIRRLAAQTLAQLAMWDQCFRNALSESDPRYSLRKHLQKDQDAEVRAGVLAFVMRSDIIVFCEDFYELKDERDRVIKTVAPFARELIGGKISPPFLKALAMSAFGNPRFLPEDPEDRRIYMRRVLIAAGQWMSEAENISRADLPRYMKDYPADLQDGWIEFEREKDIETGLGILHAARKVAPDLFWVEFCSYVRTLANPRIRLL
ncbi:MAG: hypothetical protein N3A38_06945, partial [Planctomycetota bacterium]|nr:hypothetical protein [Planctomycetota bacterium]